MKHLKGLGLMALAAVVAMAIFGAATASASEPKAEPEGGTFPVTFTGSGGTGVLEVTPESGKVRTVHCTGNTSSGEISSANTAKNIKVDFSGCTTTGPFGNGWTCTTSGATSGHIVTNSLHGTLVYLTAGSNSTGILLKPESGTTFATFTCKGVLLSETMTVTGTVVGKLTPINTLTNSFTLTFSQKEGHQEPSSYLSNTGCVVTATQLLSTGSGAEAFGPRESGISGSETLTTSKKIKVNATKCE